MAKSNWLQKFLERSGSEFLKIWDFRNFDGERGFERNYNFDTYINILSINIFMKLFYIYFICFDAKGNKFN